MVTVNLDILDVLQGDYSHCKTALTKLDVVIFESTHNARYSSVVSRFNPSKVECWKVIMFMFKKKRV